MKPSRRSIKKKKEIHGKRISSQDPQQPSRGANPSRHTVKRKTRTARKKRIEKKKKIRNEAKEHKLQENLATSHGTSRQSLGEPE